MKSDAHVRKSCRYFLPCDYPRPTITTYLVSYHRMLTHKYIVAFSKRILRMKCRAWKIDWTTRESNPRPWACEAHALPIELDALRAKVGANYDGLNTCLHTKNTCFKMNKVMANGFIWCLWESLIQSDWYWSDHLKAWYSFQVRKGFTVRL